MQILWEFIEYLYVVSMKGDKISSAEKAASTEGEGHASIRSGSAGKAVLDAAEQKLLSRILDSKINGRTSTRS